MALHPRPDAIAKLMAHFRAGDSHAAGLKRILTRHMRQEWLPPRKGELESAKEELRFEADAALAEAEVLPARLADVEPERIGCAAMSFQHYWGFPRHWLRRELKSPNPPVLAASTST